MPKFLTINDIISHIEGKFTDMIYVGKDYTIADIVNDLKFIDENFKNPEYLEAIARLYRHESNIKASIEIMEGYDGPEISGSMKTLDKGNKKS